jgi:hypothetical protein
MSTQYNIRKTDGYTAPIQNSGKTSMKSRMTGKSQTSSSAPSGNSSPVKIMDSKFPWILRERSKMDKMQHKDIVSILSAELDEYTHSDVYRKAVISPKLNMTPPTQASSSLF